MKGDEVGFGGQVGRFCVAVTVAIGLNFEHAVG